MDKKLIEVQSSAVARGFNNVFSGALMVLADNRLAHVPSLRLNAYNFIPVTDDDIERIEVVLGPGSTLYGPNSANGVMHIITRSPFASQGTAVQVGGGERSLRKASVRHAGVVGDKLGYKISAQYCAGTDWKYTDPEETRTENFVGPLAVETPNVFLDPASLAAALQDSANAAVAQALKGLDNQALGGNGNGTAVDELTTQVVSGVARIPFGTVSPEQAYDPHAVILTYRNYGEVTVNGLDLSLAYYPTEAWSLSGNYICRREAGWCWS